MILRFVLTKSIHHEDWFEHKNMNIPQEAWHLKAVNIRTWFRRWVFK